MTSKYWRKVVGDSKVVIVDEKKFSRFVVHCERSRSDGGRN